jgi:hypothetical protein
MKRAYLLGLVSMVALSCFGQHAKSTFTASLSGVDRMSMMKNSIDIPAWHEKSFWPVYEKYMNKVEEVSSQTYRALDDLTRTDATLSDQEAFDNARKLIDFRYQELDVRKQYYMEIGSAMNGIVSFQFLQTEALLDMMESSSIYDASVYRKYRFHPNALEPSQFTSAKYNTISKAVALSPEKAQAFYAVYARYEQECDALLGEDYTLFGFYAGEASDFTPGLAKRLGYDLLNVMHREIRLKEKYFLEMNETVGPMLAARFFAWEDYYSLVSKMQAWSDGLNEEE